MNQSPIIGKDVIETLTLGMYENSHFIFREYIQNSADQIDMAVEMGILNNRGEGQIDIQIDYETRRILIEDNATGIRADKVADILGNIAISTKDRTKQRGFRGIGRLGGLGYCKVLKFITSAPGEAIRSTLTWDAMKLKEIINDRSVPMEAAELIQRITTIDTEPENIESHYFKVILCDVSNSDLLNLEDVTQYLKMVAPIPFPSGFIYKPLIKKALEDRSEGLDEFRIYVNTAQLFKAYSTILYSSTRGGKRSIDEIYGLEFREITVDGELIALLWFGISKFERRLHPKANPAYGLRLRKGNIQIGDGSTMVKYFKEQRGNLYFVGEVHAVHPELIPNARRDFFLENYYCDELEKGLENICREELHKLYHDANTLKNAKKKIGKVDELRIGYETHLKKGFTSKEEKKQLEVDFEKAKEDAKLAQKKIDSITTKDEVSPSLKRVMERVIGSEPIPSVAGIELKGSQKGRTILRVDRFSKLSREQKKFVGKIMEIIKRELTPERAEFVIQKIEEEYK